MKSTCAVNRAKLVDEPIVEMLLSNKYSKAGVRFMKADLQSDFDGTDIICYANGTKRSLNVKRNSSKYFNSSPPRSINLFFKVLIPTYNSSKDIPPANLSEFIFTFLFSNNPPISSDNLDLWDSPSI